MSTLRSINEAGRVWSSTVAGIPEFKRRVRAEAEALIAQEVEERRNRAAKAIHRALESGATKTALRAVTTKDHWGFEEYVTLGNELARDRT